jgi:hypothetical protein
MKKMDALDSIETIAYLAECAANAIQPTKDAEEFLTSALKEIAQGVPPNKAFGITGNDRELKYLRDKKIKQYAATMPGAVCNKAQAIAAEINRMQSGRKCSPVLREINGIKKLPSTWRQIRNILIS